MECDFNCNECNLKGCVLDKHEYRPITQKQKDAYEKRKNTQTKRQKEAIEIYEKYQKSGDKSSKEYQQAYAVVRYLRDREKMLKMKREAYRKLYIIEES